MDAYFIVVGLVVLLIIILAKGFIEDIVSRWFGPSVGQRLGNILRFWFLVAVALCVLAVAVAVFF